HQAWTGREFLSRMTVCPRALAVARFLNGWARSMQRRELLRALGWTAATASFFHNIGPAEQRRVAFVPDKPSRWVWPLSGTPVPDVIGSPFGPRPNFGKYNFHEGLDLRAPEGKSVYAAAAGKIHRLTDDAGCVIYRANDSAGEGCEPQFPGGG